MLPILSTNTPSQPKGWIYASAILMYALAGFSLIPPVVSVADNLREGQTSVLPSWAFPLIAGCVAQIGYSLFLLQTRTRSAIWTLVVFTSIISCMYAVFCGAAWTASRSLAPNALDQVLAIFGLWEATASGKATLWSGAMAGAYALAAYFLMQAAEALRRSGIVP